LFKLFLSFFLLFCVEGLSVEKMDADNDSANGLAPYIPKDEFVLKDALHPVYIYSHIATGLPMACVLGGHAGEIIGGIIYFRAFDDSMNMEVEAPMDMMRLTMSFTGKMMAKTVLPADGLDGLWRRFMDNLLRHLSGKRGFTTDGTPVPLWSPREAPRNPAEPVEEPGPSEPKQEPPEPEENEPAKSAKVDEGPNECMICLEAPPDTTVIPCLHQVVCASCSVELEGTADAKVCCQCRCPIDGVFYPDNTLKAIKK